MSKLKLSLRMGLVFLAGVGLIFAIGGYVSIQNKITSLKDELKDSRVLIFQAIKEKQQFRQELDETKAQLEQVKIELSNTTRALNLVKTKLLFFQKDNAALKQEKEALEARLHNLQELKKAIRQVKIETQAKRAQEYRLKKTLEKELDAQSLLQGNRGFLVKDGRTFYSGKAIVIEVKTAN